MLRAIKFTILPTVKIPFLWTVFKETRSLGPSIEKDFFFPGRQKFAINFQIFCSQNVKQSDPLLLKLSFLYKQRRKHQHAIVIRGMFPG